MMQWEARCQKWIKDHVLVLGYLAVLALGLFIRHSCWPLVVADLKYMNSAWYEALIQGGIPAVLEESLQFTYSPLHLYGWLVFAVLFPSADTIWILKMIAIGVEILLSAACFRVMVQLLRGKAKAFVRFVGFALLCIHPILILNGAGWGQTDATYALFSILAVLLMMKDRPALALSMLGIALAWKLQAIFLLPLFGMLYFCGQKKFSLLWFLLVPVLFVASGVPMMLVGESPLFALNVYLGQMDLYSEVTYNYPNLFAIMGDAIGTNQLNNGLFSRMGVVLCFASLGGMLVYLIHQNYTFNHQGMVLIGAWSVLCCVFFLPRMHERYGIVGEMLLLCYAVWLYRPRGFFYVMLSAFVIVSAYAEYMFRYPFFSLQIGGMLNLALLSLLTWEVVCHVKKHRGIEGLAQ